MAQRAPKRKNLSHDVFETLKRRILNWEYPPGRRLIEEELCQEFGVSRSPVREALGRLAAYGLVEYAPHKGCQVKQLELGAIKDLYQVRLALELWVAERLAQDPGALPALARLRSDWTAPRPRSVEQWAEFDRQFHEGLARAAGNAALVAQLESVNERLTVLRPFDFSVEERAASTCAQHLDILDRIAAGDPEGARQAIRANIEDSLGNVERVVGEFLAKAYLGVKPAG